MESSCIQLDCCTFAAVGSAPLSSTHYLFFGRSKNSNACYSWRHTWLLISLLNHATKTVASNSFSSGFLATWEMLVVQSEWEVKQTYMAPRRAIQTGWVGFGLWSQFQFRGCFESPFCGLKGCFSVPPRLTRRRTNLPLGQRQEGVEWNEGGINLEIWVLKAPILQEEKNIGRHWTSRRPNSSL